MVVIAIGMVTAALIVGLLYLLAKKVQSINKFYEMIRDMLFFGVILTYFTKSFLKLSINGIQELGTSSES
jgi:hypothetical protein